MMMTPSRLYRPSRLKRKAVKRRNLAEANLTWANIHLRVYRAIRILARYSCEVKTHYQCDRGSILNTYSLFDIPQTVIDLPKESYSAVSRVRVCSIPGCSEMPQGTLTNVNHERCKSISRPVSKCWKQNNVTSLPLPKYTCY